MSYKPKPPVHPITKKIIERTKAKKRRSAATSAYLKLPPNLRRAVDVLVTGGTQAAAALASGYPAKSSATTLKVKGWTIAHRPDVQAALAEREQEARNEAGLTLTRSWTETRRIAYVDPIRLFDQRGNILTPDKLDDDTRAALAHFEVDERVQMVNGKKVTVKTTRVKFWNKMDALKMHLRGSNAIEEPASVVIHSETNNTQVNIDATRADLANSTTAEEAEAEYQRLMGSALTHDPDSVQTPSDPTPATSDEPPVVDDDTPDTPRERRKRIRRAARETVDESLEIWKQLGQMD